MNSIQSVRGWPNHCGNSGASGKVVLWMASIMACPPQSVSTEATPGSRGPRCRKPVRPHDLAPAGRSCREHMPGAADPGVAVHGSARPDPGADFQEFGEEGEVERLLEESDARGSAG